MLSRTHDIGAFATLLTATIYLQPSHLGMATVSISIIANIIGSLLPDIDQASNRLWDMLPGGNLIGKILRNIFLSHRTISHSILGLFLIYKFNYWLLFALFNQTFVNPEIIIYSLIIGYLSHLFLDSLTEEGIPLFFPIKWKFGFPPVKKWRIKTGRWFENWVIFPSISSYILYLFYSYSSLFYKAIF